MTSIIVVSRSAGPRHRDRGQAVVLTAVGVTVLLLMAGLGTDVGYLHYQKQQMQKAADDAAVAGAAALIYSSNYTNAARNDATANGYSHNSNGVTVTVNNPPSSGVYSGNGNYVEVIIAQPRPTFFMRVAGYTTVNVRARAVASAIQSGAGCIYALDPTDSSTFSMSGSAALNSQCGILDNSKNATAAFTKGGSGNITVTAGGIGVVGGVSIAGNSGTITPTPISGIPPFSDPLAWLQPQMWNGSKLVPCSNNCESLPCDFNNKKINGSETLHGGVYCGGIDIEGNGTVTFTGDKGPYILLGGGFKNVGGAQLIGDGVTFYNTGNSGNSKTKYASVRFGGSSGSMLTAPTSGPYAGILFFQDRTILDYTGSNQFDGSTVEKYEGAIYSPTVPLTYTGTTGHAAYSIIVGWQVTINGNADIEDDYSSLAGGASPIRNANLVE